jgi:GGDEF domain-containing protein
VKVHEETVEGASRGHSSDHASIPPGSGSLSGSFLATMLKRLFASAGVVRTPFESPAQFIAREYASARDGRTLSLVMFGFADFEAFAERGGAVATGEAVREFSRVLDHAARTLDIVVHSGWRGDSFLVALPGADAGAAAAYVERVHRAAAASVVPMPAADAGVVEYGPGHSSPDALVRAAERALAEVQLRSGNGAYARCSPDAFIPVAAGN